MNFLPNRIKRGFTLIELLVVIGILTVLFAIVLVAINPARQFSQANNTQRRSDVNAILNAIHQYASDNKGVLPTSIDTTVRTMKNGAGAGIADVCAQLVTKYLAAMPSDPTGTYTNCTTYDTKYTVTRSATDSRVTVSATAAELSETISVTR